MNYNYKTFFVFDSETGYILSGFDSCSDNHDDGFNIYTRPYKYPEFHESWDKCRMDAIYADSKREGLDNLKKENLRVGVIDGFSVKQEFVKNPNYFRDKYATDGWWKLLEKVETI